MSLTSDSVPTRTQRHQQLVHSLAVALRTVELYAPENSTVHRVVSDLCGALLPDGSPTGVQILAMRNHCLFVDDERVRFGPSDYPNSRYIMDTFASWSIGSLAFLPGLTRHEVRALLYAFDARADERSLEFFAGRLDELGVEHVTVGGPAGERSGQVADDAPSAFYAQTATALAADDEEPVPRPRSPGGPTPCSDDSTSAWPEPFAENGSMLALRTYSACLDVCRELQEAVRDMRPLGTRRLRRVTQSVVDQVVQDEGALLAMTTIKEFDDYLFTHSTNVSILAVALGQRVGYDRLRLGELCLAAFLHDLGKTELPRDLLDKPDVLTAEEWELMREHPVASVNILLAQEHLSPSTLRAIVSSFEHHLNCDLTGYPRLRQKRHISLFGRIIAVVDRYDAMTSPRAYRHRTITPHEAILYLIDYAGTQLDPVLVRLFIDLVGLYPPGTAVRLDTGEDAVVQQPPVTGAHIHRPQVSVLEGPRRGFVLDLAEQRGDGGYVCSISAVLEPDRRGQITLVDSFLS